MNADVVDAREDLAITSAVRRRLAQVAASLLIQVGVLLAAAGRLDWRAAWVFGGVYLGIVATNALLIVPKNPELIAERGRIEFAKGWDRVVSLLVVVAGLGTLISAGLEDRFGWSRKQSPRVQVAGFLSIALGYALVSWAMASNKFFSTTVRIQKDRSHAVAMAGPYRVVRHPGYVGMISSSLGTPLLLGSRWALLPAGLSAALFVLRTALEDRTLRKELDGYQQYAARVRYRLIPGVW